MMRYSSMILLQSFYGVAAFPKGGDAERGGFGAAEGGHDWGAGINNKDAKTRRSEQSEDVTSAQKAALSFCNRPAPHSPPCSRAALQNASGFRCRSTGSRRLQ